MEGALDGLLGERAAPREQIRLAYEGGGGVRVQLVEGLGGRETGGLGGGCPGQGLGLLLAALGVLPGAAVGLDRTDGAAVERLLA